MKKKPDTSFSDSVHDNFDGSANCKQCGGACQLSGPAQHLTNLIRHIFESSISSEGTWIMPYYVEHHLKTAGGFSWFEQFKNRAAVTHWPNPAPWAIVPANEKIMVPREATKLDIRFKTPEEKRRYWREAKRRQRRIRQIEVNKIILDSTRPDDYK